VIVVTGRMYQSVRRFLEPAGLPDPIICYQGAAVVDPVSGEWLRHEPIELALAKEAIAAIHAEGYMPNVYVGDELYVSRVTEGAREYAEFQELEVHEVGDVLGWLKDAPTKLVCVGDPQELDALEVRLKARFGTRLYISKSLPTFLELAAPDVTKAAGLAFLAHRFGFAAAETIAFGDGENDVELVAWAGYGVAVENAHERVKSVARWICPPASEEGVAQVLEAMLG
jgi:Cof subfamily protein (haloacid dehalogenase superfamily)